MLATYGSYTSPPASLTIKTPAATSLIIEAESVNHVQYQTSSSIEMIKKHTMDPHIQVRKTGQAFHMQFHKGSMHRNHSSEVTSPVNQRK